MINIGLQMYTVRDECEKDFLGTIEKVATIGYKGLEFCGYYGIEATELRKYIDKLGLKALSAHVALTDMQENLEKEIEYAKILGMKTIALPWLPEEYRKDSDAYLKTSELVRVLDEKCSKAGIQLCYHNHDFEFEKIGEEYVLDVFLNKATNLKLELDTFWTSFVGIDTLEYMKKNASRLQYIHLKDMIKGEKPEFAEVGEGCLNIRSFIKAAVELGVEWAFVEQDRCLRPSIESVKISYDNIKRMMVDDKS
ncbi:MAG TPA: sugar phosphate isomerase/epimerase [Ruminiclostridium sp.]